MSELTVEMLVPADLATLATQINAAHEEAQAYASKAVERALVAGDLLNSVKATLKHGEFIPWCKAHCPAISERQLQRYMKVARELPIEKRHESYLSLNEALRLVSSEPDGSTVIDVKPQPTPPWWEGKTTAENAAWCADGDMFYTACAWMDTEGVSIQEIASRLGFNSKMVESAIDPQIPDNLYLGAGEEADQVAETEMRAMWKAVTDQTRRRLALLLAGNYRHAARLAECCNNEKMAAKLSGIAEMHDARYRRIAKNDDPLVEFVSVRLTFSSLGRSAVMPAAWMELGAAALLIERKNPKWLNDFSKAVEVLAHVSSPKNEQRLKTSRCIWPKFGTAAEKKPIKKPGTWPGLMAKL